MTSNYYTFDECYLRPSNITELSFNQHLTTNFYHSRVSSVKECETQSLRNNSEFFLINDVSSSLNNNIYTNCYIPKVDNNTNTSIFGDNTIIQKTLQIFNGLFNTNSTTNPYNIQTENIDICDNLMFNLNKSEADKKCFKYSIDEQIYTPKKSYARYAKPLLSRDNLTIMNSISTPETYTALASLTPLKKFEELLEFDTTDPTYSRTPSRHGDLTLNFKNYICSPTPQNLTLLNAQITLLNQNYETLFDKLDDIKYDLSSINYLNSFDDETLRALNVNIITKSRELNNLLTSGGANNGRLDDTTLLTYFKIIENSILIVLIICFIFYFTKKKAI